MTTTKSKRKLNPVKHAEKMADLRKRTKALKAEAKEYTDSIGGHEHADELDRRLTEADAFFACLEDLEGGSFAGEEFDGEDDVRQPSDDREAILESEQRA